MAFYDPIHARHRASRSATFYSAVHYWLDEKANEWMQFDVPSDARIFEWNEWLFIMPQTDWNVDPTIYREGSLIVIRCDAFLQGDRQFSLFFVPSETEVLSAVQYTNNLLIVTYRSASVSHITLWRPPASFHCT
ncbi:MULTISPECIES: hypothetical protein [Paraburkholderia]|uniref:hypothetical protein n=1 Tax=Paraburkholderia TaxID=1822464 RepID=UPI001D119691|nr:MULTISPECIES: hypothetical protein [Paraburkholderia]